MKKSKNDEKTKITLMVNRYFYEELKKYCFINGYSVSGKINALITKELIEIKKK